MSSNGQNGNSESNAPKKADDSLPLSLISTPNPYGFPFQILNSGLQVDGYPLWFFPIKDDPVTHVRNVQALPMKDSDIFIASYLKCGTHWVSEILHMLTRGSTDYWDKVKESMMLELVDDLPSLERESVPRILNSHLYMVHLPREIMEKKVKVVHLMRNAKDVAVSWYYHLTKMNILDTFTFDSFLQGYMQEDYISMSHQLNYLRQMSEFESSHPDHPIIHIHYEDLKNDPVAVIQRLASYVGVPASESFCQQVAKACSFDNLKRIDQTRVLPENIKGKISKDAFYRKGIIGDWRTIFTDEQSKLFDDFVRSKGLSYTLKGE